MTDDYALEFIKGKRVTVFGFHKSAIDLAAEVEKTNGVKHPCTLVLKTTYWTMPEYMSEYSFKNLNRFAELLVHKPDEGFFFWLLAFLLSPLFWIFSKVMETYLRWMFPLKKYNMIPTHEFWDQMITCSNLVLPSNFYEKVEEGSIVLKRSQSFNFTKNGLIVDGEVATHIETDIVIFTTGFESDEKIKHIFSSTLFQHCIIGSSPPFYRECIHPRIPQLAILGYGESPSVLYTTEMRTKWVAHFLAGKFKLPTIKEMEDDALKWEKCIRRYAGHTYKRHCVSVLLQIYCNDKLCKDIGFNPSRKTWFLPELFATYGPLDYKDIILPI